MDKHRIPDRAQTQKEGGSRNGLLGSYADTFPSVQEWSHQSQSSAIVQTSKGRGGQ